MKLACGFQYSKTNRLKPVLPKDHATNYELDGSTIAEPVRADAGGRCGAAAGGESRAGEFSAGDGGISACFD
jgi:hypothetical protein